jgi:hypothetical protein
VNRVLFRILTITICSICSLAKAQIQSNQVINLYCEGTDYASYNAKHILVSIDSVNQQISITDPLRGTPRLLKLVETESMYSAYGDHLRGYVNLEKEMTPADHEKAHCKRGQDCKAYLIYKVEFSLNRQNGRFSYLVSGEVRNQETAVLLEKIRDWGIFRNSYCKLTSQKY